MYINPVLLKGSYASKVVGEVPDTTMVLMDGQVKSHRLVLATNPFLHQLIRSSWIPGEISTFLMPQHSVKDLILEISLPVEIEKEVLGESERIFYETCEEEKPQFSSSDSEETSEDFRIIKNKDTMTSDFQNTTPPKRHPTGEKLNQCDQCVYRTNDSNYMKRHLKRHDREKINKCQHCDFTGWAKNLRTHLKTHSVEKAHKCNQCFYASTNVNNLREHLRTHSGEKPFKCNQCDYASAHAGSIRTHLKTHIGEKPNKCNQCDFKSSHRVGMREHSKTHSREKSKKCKQCEYVFSRADHLKRHLTTHDGEKLNKCQQCDFESSRADHLRRHLETHIGEKTI